MTFNFNRENQYFCQKNPALDSNKCGISSQSAG